MFQLRVKVYTFKLTMLTKTFAFSGREKPGSAGGAASAATMEKGAFAEVLWSNFQGQTSWVNGFLG